MRWFNFRLRIQKNRPSNHNNQTIAADYVYPVKHLKLDSYSHSRSRSHSYFATKLWNIEWLVTTNIHIPILNAVYRLKTCTTKTIAIVIRVIERTTDVQRHKLCVKRALPILVHCTQREIKSHYGCFAHWNESGPSIIECIDLIVIASANYNHFTTL